ncbi:hypothetical protein H5410_019798 [Solanum commersonii]|uniref:Glycosyltransferase N-terminal domain-containing protein n=1 Tax=Solanum commersonii TaxID=4109 RepID=A0A9J5Z8D8_SOLCO|nr:hypothetical protein H5410_019798 [Solanum commersonii]
MTQVENHEFSKLKQDEVAIVMVPFPSQGHLNQLLQLSCLISSYHLPIYYVGLATHNHQARIRAKVLNPSNIAKIHFHDLPNPELIASSNLETVWDVSMLLRDPIASFIRDISSKVRRVVVVHEPMMSYNVQDVSSLPNAESYIFNSISVFSCYIMMCLFLKISGQHEEELLKKLYSFEGVTTDEAMDFSDSQHPYMDIRSGDIHNTSKVIESKYIDLMEQAEISLNKKQWAIGPILPAKLDCNLNRENICLDWLNKQPPRSVLYVSFGTITSFSDKQIKELMMGLEHSKQRFIWVLRDVDRGDIFKGKLEKLSCLQDLRKERFMSHCDWNSCLESITMGVSIAAWPIHTDQPINGFLVTEILKIGLLVRDWGKREEVVSASTIKNVVRKLMASEEGGLIRKRAEELGEAVRQSTDKGGASQIELDSFIAHITR